jgi:hypothetical protein
MFWSPEGLGWRRRKQPLMVATLRLDAAFHTAGTAESGRVGSTIQIEIDKV